MQNNAPKQVLDRNAGYRASWTSLIQSKLYLAFVISFIAWSATVGLCGVYKLVTWGLKQAFIKDAGLQVGVVVGAAFLVVAMAAMSYAFFMIRNKDEKKQVLGLGIVFGFYAVTFVVTILCFMVTLPMFTEWLPYQEAFAQPLQIIYIGYILLGIDAAMSLAVVKKMRENLGSCEGSYGPLTGMLVMLALRVAIALLLFLTMISKDLLTALLGLGSMVPVVLVILVLFKYRCAVNKLNY